MTTSDNNGGRSEEMVELGAKLRSLREAQNLAYEDITGAIHVRPFVLQAIEEGRILEVADSVYARGFVKNYCEYLYADDLWQKYKSFFAKTPDDILVNAPDISRLTGINHPTPIFRRSSMFWVYLILVLAVLGAAYLLWFQQKESGSGGFAGFFMRENTPQGSVPSSETPSGEAASPDALSADSTPAQTPAASPNRVVSESVPGAGGASVDLSWMNGAVAAQPAAVNAADNTLFIEVTGARCRLEVTKNGQVLTARTLLRGQVRSYDITSATDVRFSAGAAARVEWRGKNYAEIGADNASVLFRFLPTGEMKLVKGKSQYGQ